MLLLRPFHLDPMLALLNLLDPRILEAVVRNELQEHPQLFWALFNPWAFDQRFLDPRILSLVVLAEIGEHRFLSVSPFAPPNPALLSPAVLAAVVAIEMLEHPELGAAILTTRLPTFFA